ILSATCCCCRSGANPSERANSPRAIFRHCGEVAAVGALFRRRYCDAIRRAALQLPASDPFPHFGPVDGDGGVDLEAEFHVSAPYLKDCDLEQRLESI